MKAFHLMSLMISLITTHLIFGTEPAAKKRRVDTSCHAVPEIPSVDSDEWQSIHHAVANGQLDQVNAYINATHDPNPLVLKGELAGYRAIHLAKIYGHQDIEALLLDTIHNTLTDEAIQNLPYPQFLKQIKHLSQQKQTELKHYRKRLKNRQHAARYSKKRQEETSKLSIQNDVIRKQIDYYLEENKRLTIENQHLIQSLQNQQTAYHQQRLDNQKLNQAVTTLKQTLHAIGARERDIHLK